MYQKNVHPSLFILKKHTLVDQYDEIERSHFFHLVSRICTNAHKMASPGPTIHVKMINNSLNHLAGGSKLEFIFKVIEVLIQIQDLQEL